MMKNTENENHNANLKWRSLYEAWKTSGQSQAAFCKEKDITYASFIYWRRKFEPQKPKKMLPIMLTSSSSLNSVAAVMVYLPNQVRLSIPAGFDPCSLQQILESLGMKAC